MDLDTGAITAAEIDHADQADSATREDTTRFAAGQIAEVAGDPLCHEGVADKGDLKNATGPVIRDLGTGLCTYISEPQVPQGRTWTDKAVEQRGAFRGNDCRIRSERGKCRLRRRGGRTDVRSPLRSGQTARIYARLAPWYVAADHPTDPETDQPPSTRFFDVQNHILANRTRDRITPIT